MRSRPAPLLAAAVLLGSLAVAPAGAAGCAAVHRSGRWTTIDLPAGAASSTVQAAYARDGRTEALYVLDNRTVRRSTDGGCTWPAALSLDTAPPGPWTSPLYQLIGLAVSPPGANGKHTVYAVAADQITGVVAVPPVTQAVSTDDGAHWTVRGPSPAELAGDYPRCENAGWTTLYAGSDPATAYLTCTILSFGELALLYVGECQNASYVTHDSGASWQPAVGRLLDPAKVSAANPRGCEPIAKPRPDAGGRQVVWDLRGDQVLRSADDGRTFAPYLTSPVPASNATLVSTTVRGAPVLLLWDTSHRVLVAGGRPAVLPPLPVKGTALGATKVAGLLPGTSDVLLLYTDGYKAPRVFRYAAARGAWSELPAPPAVGKVPAWADGSFVVWAGGGGAAARDVWAGAGGQSGERIVGFRR